jgi:hypothetical protein
VELSFVERNRFAFVEGLSSTGELDFSVENGRSNTPFTLAEATPTPAAPSPRSTRT